LKDNKGVVVAVLTGTAAIVYVGVMLGLGLLAGIFQAIAHR
jgi:hypothetical protein